MVKRSLLSKIVSTSMVTMFSLSLIPVSANAETVLNSDIKNSSFRKYLDGWTVKGDVDAASGKDGWGYDDSYSLGYWSDEAYEVWTEQTITGLENGYYRIEAYTASSGGQEAHYIYANDFGGTGAKTSIPVTSDFTKVVLNFEVTNNQATIGFYAKGNEGNWSNYDCVALVNDENRYTFLKGGDLTMVNCLEDVGAEFYDENGNARDVFHILAESGFNFVRLRTHNDVGREHGSITNPDYYLPDGYQNTEDLLDLALRAKEMDMAIEVTLNYSDFWPNAGTQEIPSSWRSEIEGLNDEAAIDKLEELIYDYTKDVMVRLVEQGTTPEYISLGNEMQDGILYPYGRAANFDVLARFLNAGYKAVKDVSTNTAVVLHLDMAGDDEKYFKFLDNCNKYNVNYDVIGTSYYPFWTNKTVEEIIPWFNMIGEKYQRQILVLETGYNWNPTKADGYPGQLTNNGTETHESSPQGQKEFLDELFNGIRNVENNWVIGDLYWDPVMIDHEGIGWAMERGEAEDGSEDKAGSNVVSNTTLFDFDGHALPSLKSFRDNTEGSTTGMLSGVVVGNGGNKIGNAKVTIAINGEEYIKETDRYGRFFLVGLNPSDNVTIKAVKNGYSDGFTTTSIKAAEVTNVLLEMVSGNVEGNVVDNNGQKLSGVKVYSVVDNKEFATTTDDAGNYVLNDLPEGDGYTIYASKLGYETAKVNNVSIVNGESTKNVNFQLKVNSGNISGKVTDEDGNVVSKAKISLESSDGKKYIEITDENGLYNISYVEEGSYSIVVTKAGYEDYVLDNIEVKAGEDINLENIVLIEAFGSIYGIAVDCDNNKLSEAEVTVSLKNEKLFNVVTDENGTFEIPKVIDNGSYVIEAIKEGYGSAKLTEVLVKPGEKSEVVLRLSTKVEIENGDFDLGTLDGWTIVDELWSVTAQDRTGFGNDAPSGKYALSLWNDKAYKAKIYQKVEKLIPGKYILSAYVYNGGDQNVDNMYIKDGENITTYDLPITDGWVKVSMEAWVENDTVEIGFDFDAKSGCWTVIDSIELNFVTAINYNSLEENINSCKELDKEIYTNKSWSALEEALKIAKETLVEINVTQEKVNEVNDKLTEVKSMLKERANKDELVNKIEEAKKMDMSKYTEESRNNFEVILKKAEEVAEDDEATQETVDEAVKSLERSIKELVVLTPVIPPAEEEDKEDAIVDKDDSSKYENTEEKDDTIGIIQSGNNKYENNNKENIEKTPLPITGKESSMYIVAVYCVAIGFTLSRKRKVIE